MGVISWETFREGLHSKYGPTQFYDFFGKLTKLQQTGSVREYQTQFEKLLAKAGSLSQTRQVSCFVSGLKESIKVNVLASKPNSLSAAISLARLYEACNLSQRKAINSEVKKSEPLNRSAAASRPSLPVRKMSLAEIAKRHKKGLCYNCNEKFSPSHRCRKLFVIEAYREDDDNDVIMEEEDLVKDGVEAKPEISFHAISGTHAPKTMRVNGSIGHIATTVLVDSGSTHNFINAMLAKKVGLQPIMGGRFEVVVASGEKLSSPAVGVAQTYFEHIFKLHGMLRNIVCDRDPIFTSGFWSELFRLNGTEFNYSSAYHPQTDGQSEVVNRTIKKYLRCFTSSQPKDWNKWLTWAEYCYNTSWHSAIKKTPFEVVYGRTPPTLLSYIHGTTKVASMKEELLSRNQIVKELRVNLKEAQERMKKVLKKIGAVAYKLELHAEARIHPVSHVSLLKKKLGENVSVQTQLPLVKEKYDQLSSRPQAILDHRTQKKKERDFDSLARSRSL
ncbi:hypothetical protein F0562_034386 [Nyssa sinensis]|uniref:Integrase catalytic domain-containing protein n=1 Tax=Nyssa sinensis TaxID=561372 RepID=A0A5J5AFM4_9ASTE|nr:hypothetical protein F0562_034386 [Nyssa sinensis]